MQITSALQSLMALAVIIPSAVATPIAALTPAILDGPSFSGDADIVDSPLSKRSFAKSCYECNIGNSVRDLTCKCTNNAGTRVSSYLNLDKCIVNQDGHPRWRLNGGFSSSCRWLSLGVSEDRNSYILTTICKKPNGEEMGAWLNLNERIHNSNGVMRCDV